MSSLCLLISTGDVKLQNLLLKREALEKFNLPIDIKEGYLSLSVVFFTCKQDISVN